MSQTETSTNLLGELVHWQTPADDDQANWVAQADYDGNLHFHRLH